MPDARLRSVCAFLGEPSYSLRRMDRALPTAPTSGPLAPICDVQIEGTNCDEARQVEPSGLHAAVT